MRDEKVRKCAPTENLQHLASLVEVMMLTFVHRVLLWCFISVFIYYRQRYLVFGCSLYGDTNPRPWTTEWTNLISRGIIIVCDIKVILRGALM